MKMIEITWKSADELLHDFNKHIKEGGLFLRKPVDVAPNTICELILIHPHSERRLIHRGKVVFVGPASTGIEIEGFNPNVLTIFSDFVFEQSPLEKTSTPSTWIREASAHTSSKTFGSTVRSPTLTSQPSVVEAHETSASWRREPSASARLDLNVHERVRHLGLADRRRLATTGNLSERTALEKAYGKDVWELLLRNPQITVAEVARIARMGTLPIPLVDSIVLNPGWLANPQVRRALLSNPRLQGHSITTVLKACARNELRMIQQQRGYPSGVRDAARKLDV